MTLFSLAKFKRRQPEIAADDHVVALLVPADQKPSPRAPSPQAPAPRVPRAFVLLKSGRRLDLLDPQPDAWTDEDLAAGLARTLRWGGASKWSLPLSVAQHALTILALREAQEPLTAAEGLCESSCMTRPSSCWAGTASRL